MFQKSVAGGSASAFEHLAARLNLTSAKKAEDDEENKKKNAKADDDDSKAKKSKADGDREDHHDEDDNEKKSKAEEPKKEDDDGDKDDKKSKKSKSKAADDDKKDDDKDDKKEARAAERKRIADIILSPEANASNACYQAAVRLALKSNMAADEALAILWAFELSAVPAQAPAPKDNSQRDALAQRMAQSPKPDIGVDGGDGGSEPTLAQKIILAGRKRRGEI
jgi:hypothetical protein